MNGMIYNRGSQADFDHLADLGLKHWSWEAGRVGVPVIEDNALGALGDVWTWRTTARVSAPLC